MKKQRFVQLFVLLSIMLFAAGAVSTALGQGSDTHVGVFQLMNPSRTEGKALVSSPIPASPTSKELVVCMAQEPETLYVYGGSMLVMTAVLHGIYENDYTTLNYSYQSQGIEKIPSLADGDAVLQIVTVQPGNLVVDILDQPNSWGDGVTVENAAGEEVLFDGNPVQMHQLVVETTFKPRVWSDGVPVTASDSVYSYQLEKHPDTPRGKYVVERTASYVATDALTVEWKGLPGFMDAEYQLRFWQPLPEHLWHFYTEAELLTAEVSRRMPAGDGPFMITEWIAGDHITLVKNPHYYRSNQGLPYLDSVTYRFISDTNTLLAHLLAGTCHIATQDGVDSGNIPFLQESEEAGVLNAYFSEGTVWEHIDFGILPADERTLWFQDVRVRQAMTLCTDRQAMVDNVYYGTSKIQHSYIPDNHPLYNPNSTEWGYDPNQANTLLDEAGFVDTDQDGIRNHPQTGENFSITYITTSGNSTRQQIAEIFADNQTLCGIDVVLEYLDAGVIFADGPDGPIFGRKFDLAQFAWLTGMIPTCDLYLTSQIPGEPPTYPAGWDGQNNTGWSNKAYDIACMAGLEALPGTPEYVQSHQAAHLIFSQELPVIPLLMRVKVAATHPEVRGFNLNSTQNSELYNLYQLDFWAGQNFTFLPALHK